MVDIASPHAPYVLAVYGLLLLFVIGFGLHGILRWRAARKAKE